MCSVSVHLADFFLYVGRGAAGRKEGNDQLFGLPGDRPGRIAGLYKGRGNPIRISADVRLSFAPATPEFSGWIIAEEVEDPQISRRICSVFLLLGSDIGLRLSLLSADHSAGAGSILGDICQLVSDLCAGRIAEISSCSISLSEFEKVFCSKRVKCFTFRPSFSIILLCLKLQGVSRIPFAPNW